MRIEIATQATEELWDAFQRLVPQLTSNNPPPTLDDLAVLVKSESSTLVVSRHNDAIVGAACVAVYRVPTGIRAIIEDVIVDESARGQGIGEALVRRCLEVVREKGASGVSLISKNGISKTRDERILFQILIC